MALIRLDRALTENGYGSRSEIKKLVRLGKIRVNENIIKSSDVKIDVKIDVVAILGEVVKLYDVQTFILNKPAGYVCATNDNVHKTVMELIDAVRRDVVPVGRLDIDTEGLLILTSDGDLNHRLVSPKNHVVKKYYARIEGRLTADAVKRFNDGIILEDGDICKSAELEILSDDEIIISISEGKFHQVKRMVLAVGAAVKYLRRIEFGGLKLDELGLGLGESRLISSEELKRLGELNV